MSTNAELDVGLKEASGVTGSVLFLSFFFFFCFLIWMISWVRSVYKN